MKKQNAAIWCALLLIALPIAVLLLVPSPSARIVDMVQPLMESEEIDYWNPDIFFLTKYGFQRSVRFGADAAVLAQAPPAGHPRSDLHGWRLWRAGGRARAVYACPVFVHHG